MEEGSPVCENITDERVWRDRDESNCGVYGDGWSIALRGCIPRYCGGIA